MPAWWPEGERWPPDRPPSRRRSERAFPVRVALLFAVAINLIAAGVLVLVRVFTSTVPWPHAWPVAATALVVATVGSFVLAMRWIGAPLSDIVAAARRVADGDLSVRVAEDGFPWLRSVASAFNTMTARLQRQQQERQALLADIAHELRTPLAVIQGRAEGMLDGVYPRDELHVRQVLEEARMLGRLVEDLRTSAHAESGTLALRREPTDLGVLIEDAAAAFGPEAGLRTIRVETRVASDLPPMDVDPHRIREVLANLLTNALRHSPDGGVVSVECDLDATAAALRVIDRGPGIPPRDLPRIFDRFYKGPASTGSGLGLSIARSLVVAHGGAIVAENRVGGGTTITVTLPVAQGGRGRVRPA